MIVTPFLFGNAKWRYCLAAGGLPAYMAVLSLSAGPQVGGRYQGIRVPWYPSLLPIYSVGAGSLGYHISKVNDGYDYFHIDLMAAIADGQATLPTTVEMHVLNPTLAGSYVTNLGANKKGVGYGGPLLSPPGRINTGTTYYTPPATDWDHVFTVTIAVNGDLSIVYHRP